MTTINAGDSQTISGSQQLEAPINVAGELNVSGELNIDLKPAISGVVKDKSNNPIEGATVNLFLQDQGTESLETLTDANGFYSFSEHPDATGNVQTWHVLASYDDGVDKFFTRSKFGVRASLLSSSNTATPSQVEFTTTGTQTWVVPQGVFDVSIVAVGGGGGGGGNTGADGPGSAAGGGGGLGWVNNVEVTPGESYTVAVGAGGTAGTTTSDGGDGGDSFVEIDGTTIVLGGGGDGGVANNAPAQGGAGGGFQGDGGGNGGTGGPALFNGGGAGGGGAGGYTGDGGDMEENGSGGGGGGGFGVNSRPPDRDAGGGGVGLEGEGPSGVFTDNDRGGSNPAAPSTDTRGGLYGGGGGGCEDDSTGPGTAGGQGAVRIIWGNNSLPRKFPDTNTEDV